MTREAILLFLAVLQIGMAHGQTYMGPKCLGPFCLDKPMSADSITNTLGPSHNSPCCSYRAKDQHAFLTVSGQGTVANIGLSIRESKYLEYYAVTKQNLHAWKTPEGISLGSSEEEIINSYGKPSREETAASSGEGMPTAIKAFIYRGRFGAGMADAFFRVEHGHVTDVRIAKTIYSGPECLGPFCLANTLKRSSTLFRELGSLQSATRVQLYCYHASAGKAFLRVAVGDERPQEISGWLLSDFPTCQRASWKAESATNANLQDWKTPEGIGLGSRIDDVLRAYGNPTRVDHAGHKVIFPGYKPGQTAPNPGDKQLYYVSEEVVWASFGIRDGRVSYIWLSDSE